VGEYGWSPQLKPVPCGLGRCGNGHGTAPRPQPTMDTRSEYRSPDRRTWVSQPCCPPRATPVQTTACGMGEELSARHLHASALCDMERGQREFQNAWGGVLSRRRPHGYKLWRDEDVRPPFGPHGGSRLTAIHHYRRRAVGTIASPTCCVSFPRNIDQRCPPSRVPCHVPRAKLSARRCGIRWCSATIR
jgi:hypothetical protein